MPTTFQQQGFVLENYGCLVGDRAPDRRTEQVIDPACLIRDGGRPALCRTLFEVFFDQYPKDEIEIVGVSVQSAFGETLGQTARRIWRFYGAFDFARLGARYAGVKARGVSIAALTTRYGLPLVPCDSVNAPEYVERARSLQTDVIVSVAAPEIFRADILAVPRLGCINIHSGRLPVYRGMMPTFWQLLRGEKHVVITVHEMVEAVDAGAVLGTLEWPLREPDNLDRVITETKRAGARLMINMLRRMRVRRYHSDAARLEREEVLRLSEAR